MNKSVLIKYHWTDNNMITISKAPVRIGLSGGGTDIESYFTRHTGATLNATINSFVRCYVEDSDELYFSSIDNDIDSYSLDKKYIQLHSAIYEFFCEQYLNFRPNLKITTYTDIEAGSGLGTSSTLVVAILAALGHHFRKHLCPRTLVKHAYYIERHKCGLEGGWQDYISAAYGGFNFTTYDQNGEHWVKPINISSKFKQTLEESMVLFFSGVSRDSDRIIRDQIKSASDGEKVQNLHRIRENAFRMYDALEQESISEVISLINLAWSAKKASSDSITNAQLDSMEVKLRSDGADGFKISGAGGGGYCMVLLAAHKRSTFLKSIKNSDKIRQFAFHEGGTHAWTVI